MVDNEAIYDICRKNLGVQSFVPLFRSSVFLTWGLTISYRAVPDSRTSIDWSLKSFLLSLLRWGSMEVLTSIWTSSKRLYFPLPFLSLSLQLCISSLTTITNIYPQTAIWFRSPGFISLSPLTLLSSQLQKLLTKRTSFFSLSLVPRTLLNCSFW